MASSRTGGVRSLVRKMVLTLCGADGSTRSPTLSQDPARDGEASLRNLKCI
jgi:hypothetical protein